MTLNRYATRRDLTQSVIIDALERAGVEVWVIERPCDLLTLYRGVWQPLEVKTPQPNGRPRKRSDQADQAQMLARTQIPVVCTPLQALEAVGAWNARGTG